MAPRTYAELAAQIRNSHQEVIFEKDDLVHISTNDIIRLFKLIIPSVHGLDLEGSGIAKSRTIAEMIQIFAAIPWHINYLDLSNVFIWDEPINAIRDASEYELILSAIPKWITRLHFRGNVIFDLDQPLPGILRSLPASVKFLYLSDFIWSFATMDEVCAVIESIPETVTHLSLDNDRFKNDMYLALSKIKPTVEYLSLRNVKLSEATIKVSEVLTYIPKTVTRLSLSNDIIIRDDWELNARLNALAGKVIDGIEWTNSSKDQFAFKKYADVKIRYGIFKTVPFYFDQDFVLTKGCAFATQYYQNKLPLLFREFTVKTEQKVFSIPKGPVATVYAFLSFKEISRLALAKIVKLDQLIQQPVQPPTQPQAYYEHKLTYADLAMASTSQTVVLCCNVM